MELRPEGQPGWWKPLGVERKASDVSPFKKRIPALCSLSLLLLEIAHFFETGLLQKARSHNIWPSLKIEPTPRQISEETLESLKLREKNFERQTTPSSQTNRRASPRVASHDDKDRRDSLQPGDQRHFNLKASTKQNLHSAESWGISKVKLREFSI